MKDNFFKKVAIIFRCKDWDANTNMMIGDILYKADESTIDKVDEIVSTATSENEAVGMIHSFFEY